MCYPKDVQDHLDIFASGLWLHPLFFCTASPIITVVNSGWETEFTSKSMCSHIGSTRTELFGGSVDLLWFVPHGQCLSASWGYAHREEVQRGLNTPTGLPGSFGCNWSRERQAGANELVFILFCRSGLDLGQKYPEENFSRLELTLYRQNVVFTSLSWVLGKVKRIPGNWRVWTLEL